MTEEVETVPSVTSIRSVDSRADNWTSHNFTVPGLPGEDSYWKAPTTASTIKKLRIYYNSMKNGTIVLYAKTITMDGKL